MRKSHLGFILEEIPSFGRLQQQNSVSITRGKQKSRGTIRQKRYFGLYALLLLFFNTKTQALEQEHHEPQESEKGGIEDLVQLYLTPLQSNALPSSMSPSAIPSSLPSIEQPASLRLSLEPSVSLGQDPSIALVPSAELSNKASVQPSSYPSGEPSSQLSPVPSITPVPSLLPSGEPSSLPSTYPTDVPSFLPSSTPSIFPSGAPSSEIYSQPSEYPSGSPSRFPSMVPSLTPTVMPTISMMPTASLYPSLSPSLSPTFLPSDEPTSKLSFSPTTVPTSSPSSFPSSTPTESPSHTPTSTPSSTPTRYPSSSPTETCHDNRFYVSPINSLTCADHQNTPCTEWRFIGLNDDEVADLINNCPKSCGIECGSFSQVEITYSYVLSYVDETLTATQHTILENVFQKYLSAYVVQRETDGVFIINQVRFLQREILSNRRLKPRMRRSLKGIAQLQVSFLISGYLIDLSEARLMELLDQAVNSTGFSRSLRISDSFFNTVEVSSKRQEIPAAVTQATAKEKYVDANNTATITVSVLAGVTIIGALIVTFAYRGEFARRNCLRFVPILRFVPAFLTPLKVPPPLSTSMQDTSEIHVSARGRAFSFGESPSSIQTAPMANGLLRLLGSLSSRSRTSTSCSSEIQSGSSDDENAYEERSIETGTSLEEHPLAGIMPPMILIDIEDTKSVISNESRRIENGVISGMPVKYVEATSEFIAALSQAHGPNTSMSLSEMMHYTKHIENEAFDVGIRNEAPLQIIVERKLEIIDDNDVSVVSTPIASISDENGGFFLRRVASSSALDDIEPTHGLHNLIRSQWQKLGLTSKQDTTEASSLEEEASVWPNSESIPPQNFGKVSFATKVPQLSPPQKNISMTPTRHSFMSSIKWNRVLRSSADASTEGFIQKVLEEPRKEGSTHARKYVSKLCATWLPERSLCATDCFPTIDVLHSRDSSLSSLDRGSVTSLQGENLYSYEAPCDGKLGVIIESSCDTGPTIHAVKDYSPLFGKVNAGDKIIQVDGDATKHMSTGQVTRLLAQKKSEKGNGMVKITVARPIRKAAIPVIPRSPRTAPIISPGNPPNYKEEVGEQKNDDGCLIGSSSHHLRILLGMPSGDATDTTGTDTKEGEEEDNAFHLIGGYTSGDDDDDDDNLF